MIFSTDNSLNNNWDNGVKGNFWSDYTGLNEDGVGIGDDPYHVTGCTDNFFVFKYSFIQVNTNNLTC